MEYTKYITHDLFLIFIDNQLLQSLNRFSESAISILGNGSLAIRLTANSNEDNYTCTANNGIGNQLTKTVSLKVHSKSTNYPT